MKSVEWKTYRTRFLVQAKQLTSALSFVDPLGRQHCGRKGDYLVESSEGVLTITPRRIFEDIYVPMMSAESQTNRRDDSRADEPRLLDSRLETLQIHEVKINDEYAPAATLQETAITRRIDPEPLRIDTSARVRRKLPQAIADRPVSTSRLGLM